MSTVVFVAVETLTGRANGVPPRTQKRVMTSCHLLRQYIDTFVIKWRESTKQGIKNTTKRPHVDAFAIALVLHDLRSSISDGATRRHSLFVPDHFAKTKVGDLEVTVGVDENVCGFDVSVYNAVLVDGGETSQL